MARAQTSPVFEVASIHPNLSGSDGSVIDLPESGRLRVTNATLKTLIRFAYLIQNDQIVGGPKWLDSDRYDIEAKTARPISESQEPALMQNLLADRFRLRVHRERRELTVYDLMQAKSGPLFKESTSASSSIHTNRGPGKSRISVTRITLDQVAGMVGKQMGRIIQNKTGLRGYYDLTLEWDPDQTADSTVPSIFSALQEQLGLRLESQKGMVDVLAIDSAEKASKN